METTRCEIKMTCDPLYLADVRSWIRLHPDAFVTAYPRRQVNNLYFDTVEADCFRDNLRGVGQRGKLRFRWYGTSVSAVRGVLELKCKESRVGWKEHCSIPVTMDLTALSWDEVLDELRRHASGLLAVWLSYANRPTLINRYWREYYQSMDEQIRVTIDYDLVVYEQLLHTAPNLTAQALTDSEIVVEVKADPFLSHRISDVLTSFPLQVGRNSKYVKGIEDTLFQL